MMTTQEDVTRVTRVTRVTHQPEPTYTVPSTNPLKRV